MFVNLGLHFATELLARPREICLERSKASGAFNRDFFISSIIHYSFFISYTKKVSLFYEGKPFLFYSVLTATDSAVGSAIASSSPSVAGAAS